MNRIKKDKTVFEQMYSEMKGWSAASFRRSYVGRGHGGQPRAFKVKFVGEGCNDYGGPYRALFDDVVTELVENNVKVFAETANAKIGVGDR